jgi:hypothetical protein
MQDNFIVPKGLEDKRCIDLAGQKFGFLTLLGISDNCVEN